MTAKTGMIGMAGVILGMGAGFTWVRAGNVMPAPAQPSLHTFQDSQGFDPDERGGGPSGSCDPCPWSYRYVQLSDANNRVISAGPGVLHGIIMTPCSCSWPRLYDSANSNLAGKPAIADLPLQLPSGTTAQIYIPFDVAFNEGLYINGGNTGTITIIYRKF